MVCANPYLAKLLKPLQFYHDGLESLLDREEDLNKSERGSTEMSSNKYSPTL